MKRCIQVSSIALLALLCAAAGSVQSVHAATITVTSTNDSGANTLREALANALNGDTINFAVATPASITLTSGELVVSSSVTITGPGPDNLAINGNNASGVFYIAPIQTVTISSLTITNGRTTDVFGSGGIFNDHATLTVSNCTLSGNKSDAFGGGIYNNGEHSAASGSASLYVFNSTFIGNSTVQSGGGGGGIFNLGSGGNVSNTGYAVLQVFNSTFSGNSGSRGAGISSDGSGVNGYATATIVNCTFSRNSGNSGGGVRNEGGFGTAIMEISQCTFSTNSGVCGGSLYNHGQSGVGTVVISNSTLSGNQGSVGICNNYGGTLMIGNTILNDSATFGNIFNESSATVISLGYNLSNDAAGGDGTTGPGGLLNATGDIRNTNPMLDVLFDNGGPTLTHALLPGSPAINAGDPGFSGLAFDQRGPGFPRVVGGRIDIGAFEVQSLPASADLAVTKQAVKTKLKGSAQLTYTIPVHNFGPDQATGVVLTDPLPAGTTFLSVSSTQGTSSAPPVGSSGTVTCNLGSLPSGATATVTIGVTITVKGKATITNNATVSSATPDPNPGNNSVTIQTSTTGK